MTVDTGKSEPSSPETAPARSVHAVGMILTLGLGLGLFWVVLFEDHELAYRDSASLYQPMFEWIAQQRLEGHWPLWCPLDNWGAPVVADGTSCVFYPPQALFLLNPFVSTASLFGWYCLGHVLLAAWGMRWCAGRIGLSPLAQWMTALAYGFCGPVLFQTCNVVFLVSSAWLPWAMGFVIQCSRDRDRTSIVGLSIVLAMMILGGDPQMAIHALMIALGWWLVANTKLHSDDRGTASPIVQVLLAWTATLGLTALLAAVQIVPSMQWSRKSERVVTPELNWKEALERPEPGTHRDAIYQFSLPPWQVAEAVWPNILGRIDFANNQRWADRLPGADRVWTGSLYFGSVVFLLALATFFRRRKSTREKLISWIALLFLLGAFGWYGIGWVLNELNLMRGGVALAPALGEPTGGVYWWLEVALPAYSRFRYPAKLAVVATWALIVLGGCGLDRWMPSHNTQNTASNHENDRFPLRVRQWLNGLIFLSLAATTFSTGGLVMATTTSLRIDSDLMSQLAASFGQTFVVLIGLGAIWFGVHRKRLGRRAWQFVLLGLIAVDLIVANGWTIATVPRPSGGQPDFPAALDDDSLPILYRPHRMDLRAGIAQGDALAVQLRIDRKTLYPKHHWLAGIRVIGSYHSIQPLELSELLSQIERLPSDEQDRVLAFLGTQYRLRPERSDAETPSTVRWIPLEGRTRFYFADDWEVWQPADSTSYDSIVEKTEQLIDAVRQKRPTGSTVFVEVDRNKRMELSELDRSVDANDNIELIEEESGMIRLEISAAEPRLLVVADDFDRGWQAWRVDSEGRANRLSRVRVNRVQRGLIVPAGQYQIVLRYMPTEFYLGLAISFLGWMTVLGWGIRQFRFRRNPGAATR